MFTENNNKHEIKPPDNENLEDWEAWLTAQGMPGETQLITEELGNAGLKVVSYQEEFEAIRNMQNLTDDEIEQENIWGDPTDPYKGIPPCIRLKTHQENQYGSSTEDN